MTAHIHAALMAQYAQDALTTDKPWELWEWKSFYKPDWDSCVGHPSWHSLINYRRKPERRWYRVALFMDMNKNPWTYSADHDQGEIIIKSPYFVRWLTDMVYYDVE